MTTQQEIDQNIINAARTMQPTVETTRTSASALIPYCLGILPSVMVDRHRGRFVTSREFWEEMLQIGSSMNIEGMTILRVYINVWKHLVLVEAVWFKFDEVQGCQPIPYYELRYVRNEEGAESPKAVVTITPILSSDVERMFVRNIFDS